MFKGKVITVAGHSPARLGGDAVFPRLVEFAEKTLGQMAPSKVITGLDLGWGVAVAQACIDLNIPFVAALPYDGSTSHWCSIDRRYGDMLLERAHETVVVTPGDREEWKIGRRNRWMIDQSDILAVLYDGGGEGRTACMVAHAEGRGIVTLNFWDAWARFQVKKAA